MTNRQLKTVKVRVAVAVDAEGMWAAVAKAGYSGSSAMREANEMLDECRAVANYYITAELPIPEPQEIAAKVEEVK